MLKDKKWQLVLAGIAALGGIIAVVRYFEDKEHRKTQRRIAELEEQLKREQLRKIKNEL